MLHDVITTPMRNLEIKVRVGHLDEIKDRLQFAQYKDRLEQVDTYYLLGEKRLKIRQEKIMSELIFYVRSLQDGTRESRYYRIIIPQRFITAMMWVLDLLYGVKRVVKKTRDLCVYKNTRIHLDTVVDLGLFIELETVIHDGKNDEEYLIEHESVKQMLALSLYETIAESCSDLFWV